MLSTVNDDNSYHYDSYLYKYYSFSLPQVRPLRTTCMHIARSKAHHLSNIYITIEYLVLILVKSKPILRHFHI